MTNEGSPQLGCPCCDCEAVAGKRSVMTTGPLKGPKRSSATLVPHILAKERLNGINDCLLSLRLCYLRREQSDKRHIIYVIKKRLMTKVVRILTFGGHSFLRAWAARSGAGSWHCLRLGGSQRAE